MPLPLPVPQAPLAAFCRRNHIRRLALFGSVLRDDFRPDSDVDVLVEFEEAHVPGYIRMAAMERELAGIVGRRVDMVTFAALHRGFRDEVLREAQDAYVAA